MQQLPVFASVVLRIKDIGAIKVRERRYLLAPYAAFSLALTLILYLSFCQFLHFLQRLGPRLFEEVLMSFGGVYFNVQLCAAVGCC